MRKIVLALLSGLFLVSCEKEDNSVGTLEIEHNSPVVVGWGLQMSTSSTGQYSVWWDGPNGFEVHPQTISNQANYIERTPMTLQDAGEYVVSWVDAEGKVKYRGRATIEVIPPPNAPCSLTPNTSQSDIGGVGTYNFTNRYFTVTSSFYTVSGSAGGDEMKFGFYGQSKPKPGIYEITDGYYGLEYGTVGLHISGGGMYHFLAQGGKVYVTTNTNGELSVSFCNVKFSNPINPSKPLTVSANITQP